MNPLDHARSRHREPELPEIDYPALSQEYPLANVVMSRPKRQPVSRLVWFAVVVIVAAIYCIW